MQYLSFLRASYTVVAGGWLRVGRRWSVFGMLSGMIFQGIAAAQFDLPVSPVSINEKVTSGTASLAVSEDKELTAKVTGTPPDKTAGTQTVIVKAASVADPRKSA